MKFIHTADWQIGKPFARIEDGNKRSLVQQERINAIKRIAQIAEDESASFVLVAGDIFDSISPKQSSISSACGAIGKLGIPVYVIPGNHDHGGPGTIWEQDFFKRERDALAPNLHVILKREPLEIDDAILFPCPLLRRMESQDCTAWLRDSGIFGSVNPEKTRIVLAHGSTQSFSSSGDDEELGGNATNIIDLDRLPMNEIDYIALGDWHGTKEINPKAWYAGTPENDGFQKGEGNQPGHVLVVDVERGDSPNAQITSSSRLHWHDIDFDFCSDDDIERFDARIDEIIENRTNEDLLKLALTGSLGIEATNKLAEILEKIESRLLRLKLDDQTHIAPTEEEVLALTERPEDPLTANVASQLVDKSRGGDSEDAAIASMALRELYSACRKEAE